MEDKRSTYVKNKVVNDAIIFAVNAHADTFRKGTELPYILHPAEVAAIAGGLVNEKALADKVKGQKNEIIAAAVLHDTVEDTPTTLEQLEVVFGTNIAKLVANESEDKRAGMPEESTWQIRKEETIEHLKHCSDIRIKIIAFSDKLANLRAIYRDYRNLGAGLWERFNQHDSAMHGWYYGSVLEACPELKGTAAYEEYEGLIGRNFFASEDNSEKK